MQANKEPPQKPKECRKQGSAGQLSRVVETQDASGEVFKGMDSGNGAWTRKHGIKRSGTPRERIGRAAIVGRGAEVQCRRDAETPCLRAWPKESHRQKVDRRKEMNGERRSIEELCQAVNDANKRAAAS